MTAYYVGALVTDKHGVRSFLGWLLRGPAPEEARKPRPFQPLPGEEKGGEGTLKHQEMYDTEAAKARSLMHKQKTLCNGEATGFQCKHYWTLVQIATSENPDHLIHGDRSRSCMLVPEYELVFPGGREGLAVQCNRYERDEAHPYDGKAEEYRPLSREEIEAIQDGLIQTHEDLDRFRAEAHARSEAQAQALAGEAPPSEQTVKIDDVLK